MVVLQDARLQARKPHGLGLQVPLGMDDEVSIVVTSGNVTDEMWKEYIENQKAPEPDDDFHVV